MKLQQRVEKNVGIVALLGNLEIHEIADTKVSLKPLLENQAIQVILLDLHGVAHVDSAGIGLLIGLYHTTSSSGKKIMLCNTTKTVEQIFSMARLSKLMAIYPTVEAALADLQK